MPLYFDQLTSTDLDALPRESTVFLFPLGALEDHGPHLPLGLDLHEAQKLCQLAAQRIETELSGWKAVLIPPAPLGIDCHTSRFAFSVRGYVLRDYLVDFGSSLLRQGFHYLVAFSGNPSPRQLVAVEEASRILARRTRSSLLRPSRIRGLASVQSGGSRPSDVFKELLGSDPIEHGGARDTSVALWIYQGTAQEPKLSLPSVSRPSSFVDRFLEKRRGTRTGYWGDPSKASPFRGETALKDTLDEAFPRLQAWFQGANPQRLFRSWYSVLPSNRTTFRVWILLFLTAIVFSATLYLGTWGVN